MSSNDTCPGSILTLECTVNGGMRDTTVWGGTVFDCVDSNHKILLLHQRFGEGKQGSFGECNNGAVTGQSVGVVSNSNGNVSLYVSQLEVVIKPEMFGKKIVCVHDDGTNSNDVGVYVINFGK